jgi:hypothetical protein
VFLLFRHSNSPLSTPSLSSTHLTGPMSDWSRRSPTRPRAPSPAGTRPSNFAPFWSGTRVAASRLRVLVAQRPQSRVAGRASAATRSATRHRSTGSPSSAPPIRRPTRRGLRRIRYRRTGLRARGSRRVRALPAGLKRHPGSVSRQEVRKPRQVLSCSGSDGDLVRGRSRYASPF